MRTSYRLAFLTADHAIRALAAEESTTATLTEATLPGRGAALA